MKRINRIGAVSLAGSLLLLRGVPAIAQITPDKSLPNNSNVSSQGTTIIIDGGTVRGSNLFHSFNEFSPPINSTALFNNALSITNIVNRVTGSSASNIDGILRANGSANLFLINPRGIIFGPNAKLQIGGSFLGSTANSLVFEDGFEYSAKSPSSSNLLTINVPIGLGFADPGKIAVLGSGHNLVDSQFTPFSRSTPQISSGLQVQPGQTLALVGGDIALTGGGLYAPGGAIEVGAVNGGVVSFDSRSPRWNFDYKGTTGYHDVQLGSKSLVDATGLGGGSIGLRGRNISIKDGSIALIQNLGSQPDIGIQVDASNSLLIEGAAPDFSALSGLFTEVLGNAKGADINVSVPNTTISEGDIGTTTYGKGPGGSIALSARNLSVLDGGVIGTSTASSGKGGSNQIAADTILVNGTNSFFPDAFSAIASNTRGSGPGGSVAISGRLLTISDRGSVGTNTLGSAQGGDVSLDISQQTHIIGGQGANTTSSISSSTFSFGKSGSLWINTPRLLLQEGGSITAGTFFKGEAGKIFINAPESVQVDGGYIFSSATEPPESLRQLLGIPRELSGAPGGVTLNTPDLSIINGGLITVRNEGKGPAGNIQANAEFLTLDRGSITATTEQGEGGNIKATVSDTVLLRNNSSITASAKGKSTGGNVDIDPKLVVLLENSSIKANAEKGPGGKVSVTTQGLFISPDSSITATSELGPKFNGIVTLNAPTQDFAKTAAPPVAPPQAPEVSSVCQGRQGSSPSRFVKAGTGGIPRTPSDLLNKRSQLQEQPSAAAVQAAALDNPEDPEVQGWVVYPDRTMRFTAQAGVLYATSSNAPCSSATATE